MLNCSYFCLFVVSYADGEWESYYKPADEEDEAYKELGNGERSLLNLLPTLLLVYFVANLFS